MKRTAIAAILLLSLAAFSPAPIGDKGNLKVTPERGQQQVAEEQARYQMVQGETTEVPLNTNTEFADGATSDPDGKSALAAAANQQQNAQARQVLAEVAKGASGRGAFPWLWLTVLAIIGFGSVMAFRAWMNRIAPVPDNFRLPAGRN